MEFFPELQIGWLNGWVYVVALILTDGILFLIFGKEKVDQLFDRSGWKKWQVAVTVFGKLIGLAVVLLIIFSPLKLDQPVFWIGNLVSVLGVAGLAKALLDFRKTPAGKPSTTGIYKITRHPQIMASNLVLLGGTIATGSWLALLLLLAARVFLHTNLVAEEEICLEYYGEDYQVYLDRVKRYFIF